MERRDPLFVIIFVVAIVWAPPLITAYAREVGLLSSDLKISQTTIWINITGVMCLVTGAAAGRFLRLSTQPQEVRRHIAPLLILGILAAIGAIFSYQAWVDLGVDPLDWRDDTLYLMNVTFAEEGRVTTGLVGRLQTLTTVAILLTAFLYSIGKLQKIHAVLICIALTTLLFSPRRALLITSVLALISLLFLSIRVSLPRLTVYGTGGILVFIAFFGYTQYSLGKIPDLSIEQVVGSMLHYYLSSLYVMEELLRSTHFENTWIMLSTPVRIWGQIFNEPVNVDLSIPFVMAPDLANTIPAFYYFYRSAGVAGVAAWSLGIGMLTHIALYQYQRGSNFFWGVLSALLLTGIFLSVRECLFITYDFLFWIAAAAAVSWSLGARIRVA